ncbi:hypothetical protein B0H14DRAFT_2625990 [Mycena olivaceomarginata]|nr:hypothetical protein B0H14DRAFT_2625990 [Mycena olivaceomarginata]
MILNSSPMQAVVTSLHLVFHAGFAGAAAGALALLSQKSREKLGHLQPFENDTVMVASIKQLLRGRGKGVKVLVIEALGRDDIIKWDMDETAKGGPFQEILNVNIFVNCIYLNSQISSFVTQDQISQWGLKGSCPSSWTLVAIQPIPLTLLRSVASTLLLLSLLFPSTWECAEQGCTPELESQRDPRYPMLQRWISKSCQKKRSQTPIGQRQNAVVQLLKMTKQAKRAPVQKRRWGVGGRSQIFAPNPANKNSWLWELQQPSNMSEAEMGEMGVRRQISLFIVESVC